MSEKGFVTNNVKSTVSWTLVISDLNDEVIVRTLYEEKIAED